MTFSLRRLRSRLLATPLAILLLPCSGIGNPAGVALSDAFQVVQLAAAHHPQAALDQERIRAAEAGGLSATLAPAVEVEIEASNPAFPFSGGLDGRVAASRPIQRPTQLRQARSTARAATGAAEAEARWQAILAARSAVADWRSAVGLNELISIAHAEHRYLKAAASEAADAVARGERPPDALIALQLEERLARARVHQRELERDQALLRLGYRIGLAPGTPIRLPGIETLPRHAGATGDEQIGLTAEALLEARMRTAAEDYALARTALRENPRAGIFLEQESTAGHGGGRDRHYRLGASLAFPWPDRRREDRLMDEPRTSLRLAQAEVATARAEAQFAAREAAATWSALYTQASAWLVDVLPLARERLDQLEAAVSAGEADRLDLLELRRQYLGMRAEAVQAQTAALQAMDEFHFTHGRAPFASISSTP